MNSGLFSFPVARTDVPLEEPWLTPSVVRTFSVVREDANCTIRDFVRGVRITAQGTNSNTNNIRYALHEITPGANGWRATTRMRRHALQTPWGIAGLLERDAVGGRSKHFGIGRDGSVGFNQNNYTNDTTFSSVNGLAEHYELESWLRIEHLSAARRFMYSLDGSAWQLVHTETVSSSWLTSPTHVGIYFNPNYGGSGSGASQLRDTFVDFLSWQFEQI